MTEEQKGVMQTNISNYQVTHLSITLGKPKLRSYIKLKSDYGETEGYVQKTRVKAHRSPLAHLRGGTAPLQIEIGRYACLPVEERTCKTCNSAMVEDKEHFCVGCPALKEKEKEHTRQITP